MSVETLNWVASVTGICAALLVALDAGKKVTGAGFLVFAFSSVCWIWAATVEGENPLAIQNTVLLGINLLGIYRYLWRPFAKSKRDSGHQPG